MPHDPNNPGVPPQVQPSLSGPDQPPEHRLLKHFRCESPVNSYRRIPSMYWSMAISITNSIEPGPEQTVALRKLLESKDAAIRAMAHPGG